MNLNNLYHIINFCLIIIFQINSIHGLGKYCSASAIDIRTGFDECKRSKNYVYNNDTEELLSLLDKVSEELRGEENSTEEQTKHLLLDLVRIVTIVNYDPTTKTCMRSPVCNLFKNCEIPMDIQYSDWDNDAIVAARMAALLTSWSHNEKITNTTYMHRLAIYSLLRSAISDNLNIYDAKIILKLNSSSDRMAFEANRDRKSKSKTILTLFEQNLL